jgi:hypothetical protein
MNFQENLSVGICSVPCRQTDMRQIIFTFINVFATVPKNAEALVSGSRFTEDYLPCGKLICVKTAKKSQDHLLKKK